MGRSVTGVIAAVALLAACDVSPQPQPPSVTSDAISIAQGEPGIVTVLGDMGAVTAADDGVVTVLNLAGMGPSSQARVEADGSFSIDVPGDLVNEYRVQAIDRGGRSAPVDIIATDPMAGGEVMPPFRPLAICLTISSGDFVDFEQVAVGDVETRMVTLRNDCGEDVLVDSVVPIFGMGNFTVLTGAPPVLVPFRGERSFVIAFAPFVPGPVEDVVSVQIGAPELGSRPISVFGEGVLE